MNSRTIKFCRCPFKYFGSRTFMCASQQKEFSHGVLTFIIPVIPADHTVIGRICRRRMLIYSAILFKHRISVLRSRDALELQNYLSKYIYQMDNIFVKQYPACSNCKIKSKYEFEHANLSETLLLLRLSSICFIFISFYF